METCASYVDKTMYVSTDEQKWIRKIMQFREQHPDLVQIIAEPETNDGCLYCTVPSSWLKIRPPRSATMTEEQKKAAAERMLSARNKTNTGDDAHGEEDNADGES